MIWKNFKSPYTKYQLHQFSLRHPSAINRKKVVIIGGGIAGLTLGISLHKKNIDVVINERSIGIPSQGHAFLMHGEGLSVLNELNPERTSFLEGTLVNEFSLRREDGKEIKHVQLNSWKCIKRRDLINFLYCLFPEHRIKEGREFSHFIYENNKIVAAAFLNGEVEYGDIFVGADGGNSKVRESIFGKTRFTPVKVKEIVGLSYNEKIALIHSKTFIKFQKKTSGLAFGLIPTSPTEFVWFIQYDPSISDLTVNTPEGLKSFCNNLLKSFPPVVADILESNDFSKSYIWNTRDFDMLPAFHKQNVVLIGDAAHLALPFTSAGTTNAILDAKALTQALEDSVNYEKAFEKFYELRAHEVSMHIHLGRKLTNQFLHPENLTDDDIVVPLISQKIKEDIKEKNKSIQVTYFTDPICSSCWILQPILRKLELEYGNHLDIRYCMGGLLPSWTGYDRGQIRKPADAAKHWEEVSALHEIPLDGDIWIEDPIDSSYPPSIAFKAAQIQDTGKALLFLRRLQEMVFLEKKNILKWEFIKKAAFESGLDTARLLRDYRGDAKKMFLEDLKLAEQHGVKGFPTLLFSNNANDQFVLEGCLTYKNYEEIINKLIPAVKKKVINTTPKNLFTHFQRMTEKEFAFLSNITKNEAVKILTNLFNRGRIDKFESKNGIIWRNKFAAH